MCAPARPIACSIVLTLEQTGTSLTGTWARVASSPGTLTGTVYGSTVTLAMVDEFGSPLNLRLTVKGNTMTGPYLDGPGTVSLTR